MKELFLALTAFESKHVPIMTHHEEGSGTRSLVDREVTLLEENYLKLGHYFKMSSEESI